MTTRAQTFANKLRTLREYHNRLASGVGVPPSGSDLANTLKYFSQTLLSILKDVPSIPPESFGSRQKDSVRLDLFPNMNYSTLFHVVVNLCEHVDNLPNGQSTVAEAILNVIGHLLPFLEYDQLDSLPLTVATTLTFFPKQLQKHTMELLCSTILPLVLGWSDDQESYASESVAAVMMLVFQHVEKPEYHTRLVERLMSKKKELCKDLLLIIAHGPGQSRLPAVSVLFHYWPELCPTQFQNSYLTQIARYKCEAWKPILCERDGCPNRNKTNAMKMSIEPGVSVQWGGKAPPFYVCLDCADALNRNGVDQLIDCLLPMKQASFVCESKTCRNPHNKAYATCFSVECTFLSGGRPIRFCETCHILRHQNRKHVVQLPVPDIWNCPSDWQAFMTEAIVNLLCEAGSISERNARGGTASGSGKTEERWYHSSEDPCLQDGYTEDDHKILSTFGVWLIGEKCRPRENINIEILGRLLAALFNWYHVTVFSGDVSAKSKSKGTLQERYEMGKSLEKLKTEYIHKWIQEVLHFHLEVVLSVLLPYPVEYARIGHYWNVLCDRTSQVKEGLNKLFSLVPYDIVTFDVWDYVMPYWLETIRTEVKSSEKKELKTLLRKLYDLEIGPFPFMSAKLFNFASERFINTSVGVQDQVLSWLKILTAMEVVIPLKDLLQMFHKGVESLHDPIPLVDAGSTPHSSVTEMMDPTEDSLIGSDEARTPPPPTVSLTGQEEEVAPRFNILNCLNMMLGIARGQLKLQEPRGHQGVFTETAKNLLGLLGSMLGLGWEGEHTCASDQETECRFCDECLKWHRIVAEIVAHVAPKEPVSLPENDLPVTHPISGDVESQDSGDTKHSSIKNQQKKRAQATDTSAKPQRPSRPQSQSEQSQGGETTESQAETVSPLDLIPDEYDDTKLTVQLRLMHLLMHELAFYRNPAIIKSLLNTFTYLCRHAEVLTHGVKNHEEFVKYALKKFLIPTLWNLLTAENSYLAEWHVPLLLHCLTLPLGADVFWHLLEEEFTADSWKMRFTAVERVTILGRHLRPDSIKSNQPVLTSLAHAFCNLIGSLDDPNPAVAQRTILYLETINTMAMKCIIKCFEFQFDSVISDRCLILQRMHQLSYVVEGPVFSWDFFLNRFDTISVEAQIDIKSADSDPNSVTDLTNSNRDSDNFQKKIQRARFAIARTDSVRSISSSAFVKPPYRRACSVPLHLVARTTNNNQSSTSTATAAASVGTPGTKSDPGTKDKPYLRQSSAPQFNLGRRKSKPGIGGIPLVVPGMQVREYLDEKSNFAARLQQALDLEGLDRDTVHRLVSLLLKFMASCDLKAISEERQASKAQSVVIRHLGLLLGYMQQEKSFTVPPSSIRNSTVFHAFISNVAQVLDRNFEMGTAVMHLTVNMLRYSPSPQRYASDAQPANFSLWLLDPITRVHWLTTFLVILYKYQYNSSVYSSTIEYLVRVVINTIEFHIHQCKFPEDGLPPLLPQLPRPRASVAVAKSDGKDTSNVSMDFETIQETDTPPASPTQAEKAGCRHTGHYTKRTARLDAEKEMDPLGLKFTSPVIKKKNARQHRRAATTTLVLDAETSPGEPVGVACGDSSPVNVSKDESNIRPPPLQEEAFELTVFRSNQPSVEQKMAEQMEEFESQMNALGVGGLGRNGARSSSAPPSGSHTMVNKAPNDGGTSGRGETSGAGAGAQSADEDILLGSDDSGPRSSSVGRQRAPPTRRSGVLSVEIQKALEEKDDPGRRRKKRTDQYLQSRSTPASVSSQTSAPSKKKGGLGSEHKLAMEPFMINRCPRCYTELEEYDEDTLGLAITCLSTFVHREPTLAAPYLIEMFLPVARIACYNTYSWKSDLPNLIIPGNAASIARQFLRCTFYQLAPNGLFFQIFQSNIDDDKFFKCMASVLIDFPELNCYAPLEMLLDALNKKKSLPTEQLPIILRNMAAYLECLPTDAVPGQAWNNLVTHFDPFLHRLESVLAAPFDMIPVMRIITVLLKCPVIMNFKSFLEIFGRLMSFMIQECRFQLLPLLDLCSLSNKVFTKDRDKQFLTRTVVFEFVQALKFKSCIPDENMLLLVQFILMDAGGTVEPNRISEGLTSLFNPSSYHLMNTGAAECMRQHIADCVTFVADVHTLNKVKTSQKTASGSQSLHEDTLGAHLKSAIAQFVSLEFSRGCAKDQRVLNRYLPWLYHPPSTIQAGVPREFVQCVEHIRLLSWLLLGSMLHTAVTANNTGITCQPIPLSASSHVADHVIVILTRFAEQQKRPLVIKQAGGRFLGRKTRDDIYASVLTMSSLFHTFTLCELWTMYCESAAVLYPTGTSDHINAINIIMDFWGKVTPGILQLLSHTKELSERVNMHLLALMEDLLECKSTVLAKLIPLWSPILYAYHSQLPGAQQVRLQKCLNWSPPEPEKEQNGGQNQDLFVKWLQRVVVKLGRIEIQSSAATQIYIT